MRIHVRAFLLVSSLVLVAAPHALAEAPKAGGSEKSAFEVRSGGFSLSARVEPDRGYARYSTRDSDGNRVERDTRLIEQYARKPVNSQVQKALTLSKVILSNLKSSDVSQAVQRVIQTLAGSAVQVQSTTVQFSYYEAYGKGDSRLDAQYGTTLDYMLLFPVSCPGLGDAELKSIAENVGDKDVFMSGSHHALVSLGHSFELYQLDQVDPHNFGWSLDSFVPAKDRLDYYTLAIAGRCKSELQKKADQELELKAQEDQKRLEEEIRENLDEVGTRNTQIHESAT